MKNNKSHVPFHINHRPLSKKKSPYMVSHQFEKIYLVKSYVYIYEGIWNCQRLCGNI